MTKRDFEAIAANIHKVATNPEIVRHGHLYTLASLHADYFEATYPRFNREAFISTCGF